MEFGKYANIITLLANRLHKLQDLMKLMWYSYCKLFFVANITLYILKAKNYILAYLPDRFQKEYQQ
jgi:hypothetical protein